MSSLNILITNQQGVRLVFVWGGGRVSLATTPFHSWLLFKCLVTTSTFIFLHTFTGTGILLLKKETIQSVDCTSGCELRILQKNANRGTAKFFLRSGLLSNCATLYSVRVHLPQVKILEWASTLVIYKS
jgi:hypothetical protein